MKIIVGGLATLMLVGSTLTAAASDAIVGNAAAGKKVFGRCAGCHFYNKERKKLGPHLVEIVGRKVAASEKYKYTKALRKIGDAGKIWDEKELDVYLTDPIKYTKENGGSRGNMRLKLKDAQDRADVIAFLKAEAKAKAK